MPPEVIDALAELGRSDAFGRPAPAWLGYAETQVAHAALGVLAAAAPWRIAAGLGLAWIAKEAAVDAPGAGWAAAVVADSAVDLACGVAGFVVGRRALDLGLTGGARG